MIKERWSVAELSEYLGKHRNLIHRYIKALVTKGKLKKIGYAPHTTYVLSEPIDIQTDDISITDLILSYDEMTILRDHFYKFSASGVSLTGKEGFVIWCTKKGLDPQKKLKDFIAVYRYIEDTKNECGLIDVTEFFHKNIESGVLDQLYYADQYKWMGFGRGKLAEITYYAKDTQHKKLIASSIGLVKYQLECLIQNSGVDCIAFTPHSKKRHIQLLKELQKNIDTKKLPLIPLLKYAPNGILIAQKSLKTPKERIENAQRTILLGDENLGIYKKMLLIDDFVGSGATLNETAKKLKKAGIKEVVGFAFVGNTDLSYEVIREI